MEGFLKEVSIGQVAKSKKETRAWMEALRWDRDAQAGDRAGLPSSFMCPNQEGSYRLLGG